MPRHTWSMIRDTLAEDIDNGALEPGDRLPTEPELAARFGVGRHSVRRAIEALAKEGKLSVEQGRGTFIEATPMLNYTIGKRTRLRQNLLPQGCQVSSQLLGEKQMIARGRVRRALDLEKGSLVVESRRITLADALPIAFGARYHPADRFADFVERRNQLGSTTAVYKTYGINDYVRAETTLHARSAKPDEAKLLKQHPDMPVIVIRSVDTELDGTPISYGRVVWSAARVKFSVTGEEDD